MIFKEGGLKTRKKIIAMSLYPNDFDILDDNINSKCRIIL